MPYIRLVLQANSVVSTLNDQMDDVWLLATALLLLTWTLITYPRNRRESKGPTPWPLIGSSLEVLRNYDHLYDWLTNYLSNDKTMHVKLPYITITVTADPVNVEHILKSNFANYPKGEKFRSIADELLGDGIFNVDGKQWTIQRKTASVEFSRRNLREFSADVFRDRSLKLCSILVEYGSRFEAVDMQDLFMRMTLDSVCELGFGVELNSLDPSLPYNPFARSFDQANECWAFRFADPLWRLKKVLNVGSEAVLRGCIKVIDDFSYSVIRKRRIEFEESSFKEEIKLKEDLLSRFMKLRNDQDQSLTDKNLRDIVINFIIAGRDTTAVTLSWAIYMLAKHSHVAEMLYCELKSFEKDQSALNEDTVTERLKKFSKVLTYESLERLQYLHAFIDETLRLYPAVPLDFKGILHDDVLPDGTMVNTGNMVAYSPYAMGRMEYNWGADATSFDPERWLHNGVFHDVTPFKFSAFQAGPRICLGKDSAYLQMKMTLALLCRFFSFSLIPDNPVNYCTSVILRMRNGLKVKLTNRR